MPLDPLSAATAGISLIPALYKGISGIIQGNRASKLSPKNPGYMMNQGVINNARTLGERANNFQIAGYDSAVDNINQTGATAFNNGVLGATSGGDVLDLATKIAYGQGKNMNALAVENAQGADQALLQSLNADAAAGQEYQNKNAYDRQTYEQQLREKAALQQAGNTNVYGALDDVAQVGSSLLSPMPNANGTSTTGGLTPQQINAYNQFKARRGLAS